MCWIIFFWAALIIPMIIGVMRHVDSEDRSPKKLHFWLVVLTGIIWPVSLTVGGITLLIEYIRERK